MVCSPPESSEIVCSLFAGGRGDDFDAALEQGRFRPGAGGRLLPAAEDLGEHEAEVFWANLLEGRAEHLRGVWFIDAV